MIIGEAFKRLFDGLSVPVTIYLSDDETQTIEQSIQFHYGDHKELIKWSLQMDEEQAVKYPLLWYVVAPYQEDSVGYKVCRSQFIILHSFKDMAQYSWFNNVKSLKSYDAVIEPVWQKVKSLLSSNPAALQILGNINNRYNIKDEPNYGVKTDGVRTSQSDFTTKNKQGDQSITTDFVDGRIIELKFRINTKLCIKNGISII